MPVDLIAQLAQAANVVTLRGIRRGLEKESLRVTPKGKLAQTPHSTLLGSALKHPYITTDYSEALLEFITPPCDSIADALTWLDEIHQYAYSVIGAQQEMLWTASMPCALDGDKAIPVAQYGTSNAGRMKTVYREGLGHRYGRVMQTIAGIHYNFSLPDTFWQVLQQIENNRDSLQTYKTQRYFDLIRNFRRQFWLLLYLFGASPAVCPTFVEGRSHNLQSFHGKSLYLPEATSLRMGNLGYQSTAQESLIICYNRLSSYVGTLKEALTHSHPDYEKIGVQDEAGNYLQLSTALLQIENEFYSTIRPKRVALDRETPLLALHKRGVEYIEVRCVDINPFLPAGIDAEMAHVIEVFLLHCLLQPSPETGRDECKAIARNQDRVVREGRNPALKLEQAGANINVRVWGNQLLQQMLPAAALLDSAMGGNLYEQAVSKQFGRVADSTQTFSARLLDYMTQQQLSFFRAAYDLSKQHRDYFSALPLSSERQAFFMALAHESLASQHRLEAGDDMTFAQYIADYFAQYAGITLQGGSDC